MHAIVDRRDKVVGWNGYDRERADPLPGRRVFPIFPDPGDPKRIAVPPGDGVPLTAVVLLKEAVHRNDAAPLSVGVAEPLVLGDGFGTRMDRSEIRTLVAEVRDEAPTKMALDRLSRFRVSPVDKLRFVGLSLLIHVLGRSAGRRRPDVFPIEISTEAIMSVSP